MKQTLPKTAEKTNSTSMKLVKTIPQKGLNTLTNKGVEQVICTTALCAHI